MAAINSKDTIIVTGANGGLGSAIADQLLSKPELSAHHVIYTVRNTAGSNLASILARDASSHQRDVRSLDLTDLEDVRQMSGDINARVSAGMIPPIRALILAAGYQDFGKQSWTKDSFDTTFASNYLGHWLLTLLLLGSMDKETGRVVVIGSQGHDTQDPRNARSGAFTDGKYNHIAPSDVAGFDAIAKGTWSSSKEDASFRGGFRRYGAAKLFLVMMIHELQQRLNEDTKLKNVCILGVDPGTMISGLQRHAPWFIRVVLFKVVYPLILYFKPNDGPVRPLWRSAADVLEAAVGAVGGAEGPPKGLYFDGRERFHTSAESRDPEKRHLVWTETVRCAGLEEGDTTLDHWL